MAPTWESLFRQAVAGKIEAAAAVRATTSELWAEIRATAQESGLAIGQAGFRMVQSMRSAATARRNASERFQKASPEQLFTTDHAAPDMNVRSLAAREVMPEWLARTDVTYTDILGRSATKTVSVKGQWTRGLTIGDVRDAVYRGVQSMSFTANGSIPGDVTSVENIRPVLI